MSRPQIGAPWDQGEKEHGGGGPQGETTEGPHDSAAQRSRRRAGD